MGHLKRKTFIITWEEDENGRTSIDRTCDGFTAVELLGLLGLIQFEIYQQMGDSAESTERAFKNALNRRYL